MSEENHVKATFVPLTRSCLRKLHRTTEKTPEFLMESLYWQTLGWVHTPPFRRVELDTHRRLRVPGTQEPPQSSQRYFKKSFDPKLQVENRVPYGVLPRTVAVDIEKKRYAQDLTKILAEMGLENSTIRPPLLIRRDSFSILKTDVQEGIPPEPFLDLALFDDDWLYEERSPSEWMALGSSGDEEQRPVPATAFIPLDSNTDNESVVFDWRRVEVLDYDEAMKLYHIRNENNHQNKVSNVLEKGEKSDLWVPRIYLKFEAEDPVWFAKRLHTAIATRLIIEESLRMSYYVENIPMEESLPMWSQQDLDEIIAVSRRGHHLKPNLQWIKDEINEIVKELQLEYRRAANYMTYVVVTGQNPNLMNEFENEKLGNTQVNHKKGSPVSLYYPFKDRFEKFRRLTLFNQIDVIKALNLVQSNILALYDKSLYNLQLEDIPSLDKFEMLERKELKKIKHYVHGPWLLAIADSITSSITSCDSGNYDLNQTVQHTFQLTKLGKLLKLVGFKMQDVIRFLVMESLGKFTRKFQEACSNLEEVKDGYVWTDTFVSSQWIPLRGPVFEVGLEIKGVHLEFLVDLQKHRDIVVQLFEEGLRVTQGLPRLEKLVMKKLLYNPENLLESVGSWEKRISHWKNNIFSGMTKAMTVATAYAKFYDETLKMFKEDQINYVKGLARKKTTCEQLKRVIEMHDSEKNRLSDAIPDYLDIGPFRLMTGAVRLVAIRKHEQLAEAVLTYFVDKLRENMETINDQFLVLLDMIGQETGNIEDLLDKKVWCRTVPKKIGKLSEDVNVLRSDCHLMVAFNLNMDDDEFDTYWRVQELPQITARKLEERIQGFDKERDVHKQNLSNDLQNLKVNLANLSHQVSLLRDHWDVDEATSTASDVRRIRKELTTHSEKMHLFNKRERLFGQRITEYPEIEEMSQKLLPYELFWLNAAEFVKYRERVVSEELVMDALELGGKIQEFRENLEKSLEYFTPDSDPEIHDAVVYVLGEVDEFLNSKWVSRTL